jgi:transcriptional regulator with XRE-family HTH domain
MGGIFMDYYKIGQRIRKVRKAHGLSQEELAEQINISTTHMSHIETGNTKLSLQVLVDIAAALEVRTDDLLATPSEQTTSSAMDDIASIMEHCTAQEAKILVDVVRATKLSMDKYL